MEPRDINLRGKGERRKWRKEKNISPFHKFSCTASRGFSPVL